MIKYVLIAAVLVCPMAVGAILILDEPDRPSLGESSDALAFVDEDALVEGELSTTTTSTIVVTTSAAPKSTSTSSTSTTTAAPTTTATPTTTAAPTTTRPPTTTTAPTTTAAPTTTRPPTTTAAPTTTQPPTTTAPTTAAPTTTAAPSGNKMQQAAAESLAQLNATRASVGLGPLTLDPAMSNFAVDWSHEMNVSGFRHSSGPYGENIAWHSNGNMSPEQAATHFNNAWVNSPGHYANMTSGRYTHVGIGLVPHGSGWWATHVFR